MTEISFTVNEEEYQELKETYLSVYTAEADKYWQEHHWHYVFNEPVTSEFLETEHLDYLLECFLMMKTANWFFSIFRMQKKTADPKMNNHLRPSV